MSVAIVDYGSGNLRSCAKAFEAAARTAAMDVEIIVTSAPDVVARAERIVLPGVGAFADCKAGLGAVSGMIDALNDAVIKNGRPFLGICVGMQLMASRGFEHGETQGMGWVAGDVVAIAPSDPTLKVPHMGWNELCNLQTAHPVLAGIETGAHAYFVHSYHMQAKDPSHVLAQADYGGLITAVVGRDNMIGTQFHPEKSQRTGLAFITNFMNWRP